MNLIPDETSVPTEKDQRMKKFAQNVLLRSVGDYFFSKVNTRFGFRKNL